MSDLSAVPRMSADELKTFLSGNGFSENDMQKLRGKSLRVYHGFALYLVLSTRMFRVQCRRGSIHQR